MLILISIIAILFVTLAIIVPLLEKYGKEPAPEKLQRMSRWITLLVALALVLQGIRYLLE